jgi:hypothetical protein
VAGGGGRSLTIIDAGVLPVAGTPPALCDDHGVLYREVTERVPNDAGCGNGCLWEVREQGTTLLRRDPNPSTPTDDLFWFGVSTGPEYYVFTTARTAPQGRKLMALSTGGPGSPVLIETLPDSTGVDVTGTWFQRSFYYVLTLRTGAVTTTTLKVWDPVGSGRVLATLPAPLIARGAPEAYARLPPGISSFSGHYVVALENGLYRGSMMSAGTPEQLIASTSIVALAVTDTGTAYVAEQVGQTTLLSSVSLFAATPSIQPLGTGLNIRRLANDGAADEVGALTDDGIYVVTPSSRTARLIYRGGPFIQGYPRLRGLIAESGAYYVGEVCYLDADAPDWGTVRVTKPSLPGAVPVSPGSATWITGSAEWPWRTVVVDSSSAGGSVDVEKTRSAGFVLRTVGN